MILGHAVRNWLQQHGFPGTWRRHDQAALSLPDRGKEIHDPRRDIAFFRLEMDALIRIQGRQIIKQNLIFSLLRILEIDRLNFQQGEIPFALLWRSYLARYRISGMEIKAENLGWRDVEIVRPRKVIVARRA